LSEHIHDRIPDISDCRMIPNGAWTFGFETTMLGGPNSLFSEQMLMGRFTLFGRMQDTR
jgi:hypothetical protein